MARHVSATTQPPRSSQGGVCACIPGPCQRSQECPKVAQHVSALHSPQEFPRWRVHVHSKVLVPCQRSREYPKVAQHVSAPRSIPR